MRITQTGVLFDDPDRSSRGYVLISPVEGDRALLLDPDGAIAHQWKTSGGMTNWCYLLPNGHLFSNERCENRRGVALTVSGRMTEYTPDGTQVWTHDDPYQHHDARRLNDGAIYAAFSDLSDADKARVQGGYPNSETKGGPFGEVLRHVNDAGKTVWEWDFLNLEHRLHANANRWSFGHTNTVCPMPDGTYLISCKNLNLLFIIDPKTDQVTWQYQNDDLGGQHDASLLDTGNILVFANGLYGSDLSHSQVWEIDPNSNKIVWRYTAKDDMTSFYSPHMGGAQRLPSGNTLICEGNKGCLFEVTPDCDIVREFVSPHFVQSQRFGAINWLFRARWYAEGSPEITNLKAAL